MSLVSNSMATRGGAMGVSSFPSSPSYLNRRNPRGTTSQLPLMVAKLATSRRSNISCSALQESSTSTSVAAETKEEQPAEKPAPAAKAKPAAKAPAKPLTELMSEDVIPTLKSRLEVEDDITELELSFQDNRLEGSFLHKGIPYTFWAFFPNGVLTGPKGFALASYGADVSTVEPFLIDEKKITANHVVFWVEKRLAAQGIIPVWKE